MIKDVLENEWRESVELGSWVNYLVCRDEGLCIG